MPSEWYLKNRDRILKNAADWAKANPEKKRAACKKYAASHKEQIRNRQRKRRNVRKDWNWSRYRITSEQFNQLISSQKNKCAVCRVEFGNTKATGPHIDHCHETKLVRGLLCRKCNIAEGFLETPDNARRLYEYMLKNELFYQGGN